MPVVAKLLMDAHIVSQRAHIVDLEPRRITRSNPASAALLAGPLPDPTRKRNASVIRSLSPLSPLPPSSPLPNLSPLSPAASPAVSVTSSSSPVAVCAQEEMSTVTGAARIEKDGKKVPKLQPGILTPDNLLSLETAISEYISDNKKISTVADKREVAFAAVASHHAVDAWVYDNKDSWLAADVEFSVADFFKLMRAEYLAYNWERITKRTLVAAHQSESEKFEEYKDRVFRGNALLRGTTLYQSEAELRKVLRDGMRSALAEYFENPANKTEANDIENETRLGQWVIAVCAIEARIIRAHDAAVALAT